MKKALLIIFLTPLFCFGQTAETITLATFDTTSFTTAYGYSDSTAEVFKYNNGTFGVTAKDTLTAIKMLWKMFEDANKREADLWLFIGASVEFTNTVPDYFKTNKSKAWIRYYKQLKLLGFTLKK